MVHGPFSYFDLIFLCSIASFLVYICSSYSTLLNIHYPFLFELLESILKANTNKLNAIAHLASSISFSVPLHRFFQSFLAFLFIFTQIYFYCPILGIYFPSSFSLPYYTYIYCLLFCSRHLQYSCNLPRFPSFYILSRCRQDVNCTNSRQWFTNTSNFLAFCCTTPTIRLCVSADVSFFFSFSSASWFS